MKKNISYFLFIFVTLVLFPVQASATENAIDKKPEITFIVDQVTEAEFTGHFIIQNMTAIDLVNWQLGFTFQRIIEVSNQVNVIKQIGDYYLIGGKEGNKTIPAHNSLSFDIKGKYTIRNNDDMPSGYFIIYENKNGNRHVLRDVTSKFVFNPKKPMDAAALYELNKKRNESITEGSAENKNAQQDMIIPMPVNTQWGQGEFVLSADISIYSQENNSQAMRVASYLRDVLYPATGYRLALQTGKVTHTSTQGGIMLTHEGASAQLGNEGYMLSVTPKQIILRANGEAGFFYGVQSLRQLFPPQIFKAQPVTNMAWKIPAISITDYPQFNYRGVLLDVARHFFTVQDIKKLLDLMSIHKLNVFHWHLTDDEAWRIEIKKYPQLTERGAYRGYEEVLPPALGSGYSRYGGFYTQDQIRDIVNYAKERHITIIPEIDIPAHARALIYSLPDKLIDKEDKSVYSSVRGFHDNVLSPCLPATYEVLQNIFDELITLFPANVIHIGSDERPDGAWEKSPACIAMMKQLNLKDTHQLQNYFTRKMQEYLSSKQKTLAGWEEMIEGGDLAVKPYPPLIYAWLGMNNELKAAQKGYDVILTPYQFLYLELAYAQHAEEPGDYWGGYVDTWQVYAYRPGAQIPPALLARIKGIEGGIWTEYINSTERLEYLAFPKLAALAEVAWTPFNLRNWQTFSRRIGKYYLPMLDHYGVLYRLSPAGFVVENGMLYANNEFPGLLMKYTLDGSTPSMQSTTYLQPIKVNANKIRFRTFDTRGRGSREIQ